MAEAVGDSLANFPEKEVTVVRGRESLTGEGKKTLQKLGCRLNLTCERVRRLEGQFWRRLQGPTQSEIVVPHRGWTKTSAEFRKGFVSAFLSDFIRGRGSLLAVDTTIESNLRLLCAKCIGVSIAEVPKTNDQVIGALSSELAALEEIDWNNEH